VKYFDLFSGIGGFHLGMSKAGHECVGACEIDKYARQVYGLHFPDVTIWEDATKLDPAELPEFDCLVGGFPCQAFSIAGKRRGFEDTRGSLFFEIARIAKIKRPQYLLLENVKGLLNHDEGRTFRVIISTLQELGYHVEWQVLNSKYFVPQNRERVFIIGHLGGFSGGKIFPLGEVGKGTNVMGNKESEKRERIQSQHSSTITATYWKGWGGSRQLIGEPKTKYTQLDSSGKGYKSQNDRIYDIDFIGPTIPVTSTASKLMIAVPKIVADRSRTYAGKGRSLESPKDISNSLTSVAKDNYVMTMLSQKNSNMKNRTQERKETWSLQTSGAEFGISDGTRIRRLTPLECERLQGFPDNWTEGLSDTQRYKCCGNAVTVPVVHYIAEHLVL